MVFFPRKLICPWRCCQFGLLTMQSRMQSVVRNMIMMMVVRYMRKDGTLRFGDFVAIILNLTVAFCKFIFYFCVKNKHNYKYQSLCKSSPNYVLRFASFSSHHLRPPLSRPLTYPYLSLLKRLAKQEGCQILLAKINNDH